jgi:hypothetical protein
MESKKGRYQVTVNPLETNGLPASLYFTSKFADEVGSEFIADFENPVNAELVCKRLNDYAALQAKCDRYEKALKEIGARNCDYQTLNESKLHDTECRACKANEALAEWKG